MVSSDGKTMRIEQLAKKIPTEREISIVWMTENQDEAEFYILHCRGLVGMLSKDYGFNVSEI